MVVWDGLLLDVCDVVLEMEGGEASSLDLDEARAATPVIYDRVHKVVCVSACIDRYVWHVGTENRHVIQKHIQKMIEEE